MFRAFIPDDFDDEEQRRKRTDEQVPISSRRAGAIILGGVLALVAFGVLLPLGYPGTGIMLVPLGMGLVFFGGLELLLSRLG